MKTRLLSILLAMVMIISFIPALAEEAMTTEEQQTALAMLNYLTVLTQETNDSKNSRIFMEKAYSELINNTYPNAVDSKTLSRLNRLLDTMERYRMIDVKRERLQYIYKQNQALAVRAAIPNPLGLLSTVHSLSPARLISSVVYMAVDAKTSYETAKTMLELQYLRDGWQLDDDEAAELHQCRKDMFTYMVNIVNDYKITGDLSLNENAVIEFSRWKNEENIVARIQFLEANEKTYKAYGGYWLLLAETYYQNGEFKKCIDSIKTYEGMASRIFRQDFDYARVLPLAIAAAEQIQTKEEYAANASGWAEAIVTNTRNADWALRYFAAQTYVSLYDKTGDQSYAMEAYKIAKINVNNLLQEQNKLNETYLSAVKEVSDPQNATKEQKEENKKYNQMLKEMRKTELPPVLEAISLNCDLLFSIADLAGIDEAEKGIVDLMLHSGGAKLLLMETLDNKYRFSDRTEISAANIDIAFGGTQLVIPAIYMTSDSTISVSVKEKDAAEALMITDWRLDRVERKTEGDISTFGAIYVSETAKQHTWGAESEIIITIDSAPAHGVDPFVFEYTTENTKKEWYDWLKVWEGHKNEWYDYLKVWDNSVNFVRVK